MSVISEDMEINRDHKSNDDSWKWIPTSLSDLQSAEQKVLSYLKTPFTGKYVDIGEHADSKNNRIWTLIFNEQSGKTPLVLVHGFASGVGLWLLNLDSLAADRPVYAIDVLGFGQSSRPTFSLDTHEVENQLVDSLEAWRQQMNIDKFILLGHSMGGYVVASYALRFPERLRHAILTDPWGFTGNSPTTSIWVKAAALAVSPFNLFSGLRVAGPFGYRFVELSRPDIKQKYSVMLKEDQQSIVDYVYHCNALKPSGEAAFKALTEHFAWVNRPMAKLPMAQRLDQLNSNVPVTFIYASESWISHEPGYHFQEMKPSQFSVHVIEKAGHDVYADQPAVFNELIQRICNTTDGPSVNINHDTKSLDNDF